MHQLPIPGLLYCFAAYGNEVRCSDDPCDTPQKKSRNESHGEGSGVEIIVNEPYEDGPGGKGQYTHKIYHVGNHLPCKCSGCICVGVLDVCLRIFSMLCVWVSGPPVSRPVVSRLLKSVGQ